MGRGLSADKYKLVKRAQFLAAQDVEVEVFYGLACVLAAVGDNAVAVGEAQNGGQVADHGKDMADGGLVGLVDTVSGLDMLLGDHQEMLGSHGSDIVESQAQLVFVQLLGRDLALNDLAENAVFHGSSSLDVACNVVVNQSQSVVQLVHVLAATHCGVRLAATGTTASCGDFLDDHACLHAGSNGFLTADS